MKIGICESGEKLCMIERGAADYAELGLSQIYKMSDSEIRETKKKLADRGLVPETSNSFFGNMRMCGEVYDAKKISEYSKKALYKAAQFGIHTSVLGNGSARRIPEGANREECMRQIEETFYTAGSAAAEFGTVIVIEPLNSNETNVITTVAEGAKLCRKLNHPNVKLLADIFHMSVEDESFDSIIKNADIIKHIHIAAPKTRNFPSEAETEYYNKLKDALKKANYDLRISIEGGYSEDFLPGANKSLEFLKKIFK